MVEPRFLISKKVFMTQLLPKSHIFEKKVEGMRLWIEQAPLISVFFAV